MNKIKLNTGLASIMLVASVFAGWQTMLLVTLFMFIFCEVEEKVKDVAVKVITFYVGYTIVTVGWDILMNGFSVVTNSIESIVRFINSYLDYADHLDATKLVGLIDTIKVIANGVVGIMFSLIKLGFVISVLTGKPSKKNGMSNKINEYINKAINYVNGNVNVNMNMNPSPTPNSGVTNLQPNSPGGVATQTMQAPQTAQAAPSMPNAPVAPTQVAPTIPNNPNNGSNQ